ncbi:DUF4265 domain-containing protein [Nitrospirillum iridis]|uniref:DUF4265 domain-containing protein n=1 Tax=Nitrospirillum iridis TaxID=765888 RepID=A0A7X0B480_9PROT|nr:DUF4265 domain-containing protein [Nitrospirillum iridis]MBB6255425.1 hypothetical protein [Nitrospirillum iridis]
MTSSEAGKPKDLVRISFKLDPTEWHGHTREWIWAEAIPEAPDIYRIKNSPFFTRGISLMDLVRALPSEEISGQLEAVSVAEKCGHSNYMVINQTREDDFVKYWGRLEEIGCSFESAHLPIDGDNKLLYAIDVPPNADIFDVYKILSSGEKDGIWLFQEGAMGHDVKSRP